MARCAQCGFLCYKNHETHEFDHVDAEARKTGKFPSYFLGGNIPFLHGPYCFRLKYDLPRELKESLPNAPYASSPDAMTSVHMVIDKQRVCDGFCEWRPGFTPKEHVEMQNFEELQKRTQEQREADRVWNEEMRRADLAWKIDQDKKAADRWDKEHQLQRHQLLIVGIVGTIVLAISQIIAAWIQVANKP